jgi:hypothetical protein
MGRQGDPVRRPGAAAFDAHVAEVEAEGGLLADVLENQPRLAPVVAVLRDEHVAVDDALDQLAGELVAIGAGSTRTTSPRSGDWGSS